MYRAYLFVLKFNIWVKGNYKLASHWLPRIKLFILGERYNGLFSLLFQQHNKHKSLNLIAKLWCAEKNFLKYTLVLSHLLTVSYQTRCFSCSCLCCLCLVLTTGWADQKHQVPCICHKLYINLQLGSLF